MKPLGHFAYIKAWLIYTLGATILGGIIGAVMGRFVTLLLMSTGVSLSQIKTVVTLMGLAIGLPFSYFMFWATVKAFVVTELERETPPSDLTNR